ncbi:MULTISPECIES: aromatic ring-hydroxylating oxygenase subunit alpha [Acetobacter]|uniref:aromatic ring-hydroxylating oxygenase subunit alpha n=1 Tax=Acetobacter TaxID=434 RepID=UPI000A3A0AB8|nr:MULTISPECIES: Rieske 2Fe-2S domain-containing protein [Acetobacter]MBS0980734.1 Rieske 2Fe-2S domain-containing protein [Acetobacter thailandicus]MBS0984874.1 Rieske 2Fe-2S domain-containing protein [Acetobacter thailandicus]MBS1003602.1 Rieske 2Fe-2S domain-containing protein [Acetobacter thailandicus]OUI88421.1 Rieske (2Fe-2S) protein [Acetobacter sp. DmW_043]OUJ11337.1 Rieske (2Fe-2S) protein [Acetobacter sp. DsW_059]
MTILPDPASLVNEDRADGSIYNNAALYDMEMDSIFKRNWIWVAHRSDLPEPGSFITTFIGQHPVIVSRDRKGELHVLLNRCRHRGATVCEHKSGKTASFVCPYHGWAYGQDGALRAVPQPKGYGESLDKSKLPLVSLKVAEYNGMIFATFNQDIMPLDEWLGPAKIWIDLFMKQGAGWPVKTMGEHKFTFPGNWKIQLENTTDAYHFPIVHKSFLDSVDNETQNIFDFVEGDGFVEDLGNGHSVMVMIPELIDLEENLDAPVPERFQELADALSKDYPPEKVRQIVRAVGGSGFNLNLYPNVACSMAFFRVLRPLAVDQTEIRHIAIGMDGGPDIANEVRLRLHEHFQGPMGFGTPDDSEAWDRVQRGALAGYNIDILLNRGLDHEAKRESGNLFSDVTAETGMRAAYKQWLVDLTCETAAEEAAQ